MASRSAEFKRSLRAIVDFCREHRADVTPVELTIADDLRATLRGLNDQGTGSAEEVASLLTALSVSGLDLEERVLNIFVDEILKSWNVGVGIVDQRDEADAPICDIVGTGGDGFDTFNVSTTAAIVAAGAGVKIRKHGNRASSSSSGSADILMASGVPLAQLDPPQIAELLKDKEMTFSFIFSPKFYPIFARLSPIRKSLGFPTIFNRLGPLLNPARPDRLIIGVANRALGPIFCRVLQLRGFWHAWVVCGDEGLDEISTAGGTSLWKLVPDGSVVHEELTPEESFGLARHPISQVKGGSCEENLEMLEDLLGNRIRSERHEAILDFVLMNTSALLVLSGRAADLKEGVRLGRESLKSGNAKAALERFKTGAQRMVERAGRTSRVDA